MDLILTIDTEADDQWSRGRPLATENARSLPRFQALCDRYGFQPTYLCTYEMVADPLFRSIVGPYQEGGRAEVGAHLHPWSNPPFDPLSGDGPEHHAFPHELPLDLFARKMEALTEAIAGAFGRPPTSYRAGRYGFAAEHIDVLTSLGYVVDCSVTPYLSWRGVAGKPGGVGGADFREARPGAYELDRGDCTRAGNSGLLEVPITILFPGWPLRRWPAARRWWAGRPSSPAGRAMAKLGQGPRWFRPGRGPSAAAMIAVYREAKRLGLPYAMMMFHSSELMPGGSPFFPDAPSIEALYTTFEAVFRHVADDGGRGATLTGFAGGRGCRRTGVGRGLGGDAPCCVAGSGSSPIS